MSEVKDPLLRYLALLQLIPRHPGKVSTTTLLERLRDKGFRVDIRSLQRDMNKLSGQFPIICHSEERPYRWSYDAKAQLNVPTPDTPTALALYLAESSLATLLPQGVMHQLAPQFRAARAHLESQTHNQLARWPQRVRALPNGKALIPAEIAHEVWAQVSIALVERKQIRVSYLSRSKGEQKQLCLHPLSLVSRYSISYLVATVGVYDDPRQFALHRIKSVELLEEPARQHDGFDLDAYIASGAFSLRQSVEMIELVADVHPQIAWLLNETPLSEQQALEPLPDSDWQRLRAQVPMDQETLWWVFGLGENVRVRGPGVWVDEVRSRLKKMVCFYGL